MEILIFRAPHSGYIAVLRKVTFRVSSSCKVLRVWPKLSDCAILASSMQMSTNMFTSAALRAKILDSYLGSLKYKLSFSLLRWQSKRGQPAHRRQIYTKSERAGSASPANFFNLLPPEKDVVSPVLGGRATTNKYRAGKTFLTQSINEFIGWLIALRNKSTAIYHDANFCSAAVAATMKAN